MKKYFVIIGLLSLMSINAQNYSYVISGNLKSTTTTWYDNKPGENWFGRFVTIDIYVKSMEAQTLKLYPGGFDNLVSNGIGAQDFTYLSYLSNIPLTIDTTAGVLVKRGTWWHYKFSTRHFPCKLPGMEAVWSTTDSCEVYILFNAGQL